MTTYTVICFSTDTPHYVEGARKIEGQCAKFGLPYRYYRLGSVPDVSNLRMFAACRKPGVIMAALKDTGGPVLYLDADDEIVANPREMPPCSVGLWRNYETQLFPTHLQWYSGGYFSGDGYSLAFLEAWRELTAMVGNEHRALHMAYAWRYNCFADPQPIADITAIVSGCILGNQSPLGYRPRAALVQ